MRRFGAVVAVCLQGCSPVYLDERPLPTATETSGAATASSPATTVTAAAPESCDELAVPAVPAPCGSAPDPVAVADCAAGYAALHLGLGYPTVAAGIAASAPGEVVVVCPGTWPGPVVVDREIVLEAADPSPGATVIDGQGASRGVEVLASATVRGLTVREGPGSLEPSAVLVEADEVVLECLTLEDNRGGAVAARGRDLTVRTSTFVRNHAPTEGAALKASSGLVVEDCVFSENAAGFEGGAIVARGDVTIVRSAFERNSAEVEGGAVAWGDWDPASLEIVDSTFACNVAGAQGGAVDVGARSDDGVVVRGSTFAGNFAALQGGAIELGSWGALEVEIADVTFVANASPLGGALLFVGPLADGVRAAITSTSFTDNVTDRGGSAIAIDSRAPFGELRVEGSSLLRNRGGAGAIDLTTPIDLVCTACDLGSGDDDNQPHDVSKAGDTPLDVAGPGTFEL